MKLDKKALEALLAMDDAHLCDTIRHLAAEAGVDAGNLPVSERDMVAIRRALANFSPEDLARVAKLLGK